MLHSKLQLRIMQLGLMQKDVAKACGFGPAKLSEYIHGTRALPPRHIMLLCRELKCNPEDIMGLAETRHERITNGSGN